jgi:hypothetical protein
MANFWEVEKADEFTVAAKLEKVIPELKNVSRFELVDHLRGSGLIFLTKESKPKSFWIRMSLPFGLVVALFLLITLPIKFMVTGRWHYNYLPLQNWFRALGF